MNSPWATTTGRRESTIPSKKTEGLSTTCTITRRASNCSGLFAQQPGPGFAA
jgi:hypothetical protein